MAVQPITLHSQTRIPLHFLWILGHIPRAVPPNHRKTTEALFLAVIHSGQMLPAPCTETVPENSGDARSGRLVIETPWVHGDSLQIYFHLWQPVLPPEMSTQWLVLSALATVLSNLSYLNHLLLCLFVSLYHCTMEKTIIPPSISRGQHPESPSVF